MSTDLGNAAPATPPVASTVPPVTPNGVGPLSGTGIAGAQFGEHPDDVIAELTTLFGPPTEDLGWQPIGGDDARGLPGRPDPKRPLGQPLAAVRLLGLRDRIGDRATPVPAVHVLQLRHRADPGGAPRPDDRSGARRSATRSPVSSSSIPTSSTTTTNSQVAAARSRPATASAAHSTSAIDPSRAAPRTSSTASSPAASPAGSRPAHFDADPTPVRSCLSEFPQAIFVAGDANPLWKSQVGGAVGVGSLASLIG